MFEGLGLGTRLAYMALPVGYNWVPVTGALLYGITTPVGIAAGLGVRTTYNPGSTTASIVSGILDSVSSGILLYTGLVEVCAMSHGAWLATMLILVVAGARVSVQPRDVPGVERPPGVRMHQHALRCRYNGAARAVGVIPPTPIVYLRCVGCTYTCTSTGL